MSWEFVFQWNLWGVLLLPLVLKLTDHKRLSIWFSGLLPFFVVLGIYSAQRSGDLVFHLELLALSWLPSVFWIATICASPTNTIHLRRVYAIVAFSVLVSGIFFVLTPSLTFMDPLIGVLPGTISLDPIISLDLYWQRFWFSFSLGLAFVFLKYFKTFSPLKKIISYFALAAAVSLVLPNSLSPKFRLEMAFDEKISAPPFNLFIQTSAQSNWNAKEWLEEFQFQWEQLRSRLPNNAQFRNEPQINVYIYKDDEEKRRWIGAAGTQIGNFVRDEMHLSGLEIDSPTIAHELAHMMHGFLDVPIKSYTDPFIFEGFAVALSEDHPKDLLEIGAALKRQIGPIFEWPLGFRFFYLYSGPVSYRLAGTYSLQAIQKNEWPWASQISADSLNDLKISEKSETLAKQLLKQPSLFRDPLVRDCSRLFLPYRRNANLESWSHYLKICRNSPLSYHGIFLLPDRRELALLELSKFPHPNSAELQGDIAIVENLPKEAMKHYSTCLPAESCRLKLKTLDLNQSDKLKSLLLTSLQPTLDLLSMYSIDANELQILLPRLKLADRQKILKDVRKKRVLDPEENFELLKASIYLRENKNSILSEIGKLKESDRKWIRDRLAKIHD